MGRCRDDSCCQVERHDSAMAIPWDVDAMSDAADDGVSIRDGVSKDRMLSVQDPELRPFHKSAV